MRLYAVSWRRMIVSASLLPALCLLVACGQATAGPTTTAQATATLTPTPPPTATSTPLPAHCDFGTPASAPPTPALVHLTTTTAGLFALDAKSGTMRWKAPSHPGIEDGFLPDPPVVNGLVYARENFGRAVTAYDAKTGAIHWSFDTGVLGGLSGGSGGGPVAYAAGLLYLTGSNASNYATLYALDAQTGAVRWKTTAPTAKDNFSAPAVGAGLVYVVISMQYVAAFDAATGASRWQVQAAGDVDSPPAEGDGIVYAPALGGSLGAFSASSGAPLWQKRYSFAHLATPLVAGKVVYLGADDSNIYALNSADGAVCWRFATDSEPEVSIVTLHRVADGVVYAGSSHSLYAVDAQTGALKWRFPTVGPSVSVTQGVVFMGSNNGEAFALRMIDGHVMWHVALPAS